MKKVLFCLLLAIGSAACADELADANKLRDNKAYAQALPLYTKLANAGNAQAQYALGTLYLQGEGTAADADKAQAWYQKAAAKGHREASAALDLMRERNARRADIAYWTGGYDGADLKAGKFNCRAPRIPAISKQNEDIRDVSGNVIAWQECYNGFVEHLNGANPLTQRIPADVAKLMNKAEMERATAYLEELHARIAADASIGAKLILADYAAWRSATEAYVEEHNKISKAVQAADRPDFEARKNNYAPPSK